MHQLDLPEKSEMQENGQRSRRSTFFLPERPPNIRDRPDQNIYQRNLDINKDNITKEEL